MSVWDKHQPKGDYPPIVSFDQVGASFAGIFAGLRSARFAGQADDAVIADFSEPWNSVVLGSTDLFNKMYEAKPEPGDRVDIQFVAEQQAKVGKAKLWNVIVTKANGQAPAIAQAPLAAPQPPAQPGMMPPLGNYQPPAAAPAPTAPLF